MLSIRDRVKNDDPDSLRANNAIHIVRGVSEVLKMPDLFEAYMLMYSDEKYKETPEYQLLYASVVHALSDGISLTDK